MSSACGPSSLVVEETIVLGETTVLGEFVVTEGFFWVSHLLLDAFFHAKDCSRRIFLASLLSMREISSGVGITSVTPTFRPFMLLLIK